jgi:hypothetical protein
MSRFLHHLASMALGVKPEGAARLSLPPRYSGLPADRFPLTEDASFTAAPEPVRFAGEGRADLSAREPARTHEAPSAQQYSAGLAMEMPPQFQPPAREAARHPPQGRQPMQLTDQHAQAPASPKELTRRGSSILLPAKAPVFQQLPAGAPTPAPHLATAAPAAKRSANRAMPLSEAALAGRTPAARELAPVIHVTIDRIDVRAPAPSQAPPAQRKARTEPVVSLSDYLRGGGGGRG